MVMDKVTGIYLLGTNRARDKEMVLLSEHLGTKKVELTKDIVSLE